MQATSKNMLIHKLFDLSEHTSHGTKFLRIVIYTVNFFNRMPGLSIRGTHLRRLYISIGLLNSHACVLPYAIEPSLMKLATATSYLVCFWEAAAAAGEREIERAGGHRDWPITDVHIYHPMHGRCGPQIKAPTLLNSCMGMGIYIYIYTKIEPQFQFHITIIIVFEILWVPPGFQEIDQQPAADRYTTDRKRACVFNLFGFSLKFVCPGSGWGAFAPPADLTWMHPPFPR